MVQYLGEYGLRPTPCADFGTFLAGNERLQLGAAPLAAGFVLTEENLALITEAELYADTVRRREAQAEARRSTVEGMLRDLSELKTGDPVVHAQHGIGRYLGLVTLDLGEGSTEFLHLEYAESGATAAAPLKTRHCTGSAAGSGKKLSAKLPGKYATAQLSY
jgi:transcription-repair coupling factor (superfamily II helicase)